MRVAFVKPGASVSDPERRIVNASGIGVKPASQSSFHALSVLERMRPWEV